MSARVPVILLLIAVALGAYIFAFERGLPSRSEIDSRAGLLLEGLVRNRITRVRITSAGERVALRREGEGFDETWSLEEPDPGAADPERVEDYLRSWEFAIPVRTLEAPSPEDVASFGLDSPTAEVVFEMGRGEARASLGTGTPIDGGGYIRIGGSDAVVVVGEDVVDLFNRSAESFALPGDAGAPTLSDLVDGGEPDAGPPAEDVQR